MSDKKNVYEIVTEQIVNLIESTGELPWHKPWVMGANAPRNLQSKREYNGFNVFYLAWTARANNWGPYWLTWNQCAKMGGTVKAEENKKWTLVTFWKFLDGKATQNEAGETVAGGKIPMLRYYRVYNADQCEGLKIPAVELPNVVNPVETAESIVKGFILGPSVIHGNGSYASYSPLLDTVNMPQMAAFKSVEGYYGTLFHELTHSTGHEKRLNRKTLTEMAGFGSQNYSREELVAELGAAMLCAKAGIAPNIENSAAYVKGWLKAIKDDSKAIVMATSQAYKAVKMIAGETEQENIDADEAQAA